MNPGMFRTPREALTFGLIAVGLTALFLGLPVLLIWGLL